MGFKNRVGGEHPEASPDYLYKQLEQNVIIEV
jgi:hypothetical protein